MLDSQTICWKEPEELQTEREELETKRETKD